MKQTLTLPQLLNKAAREFSFLDKQVGSCVHIEQLRNCKDLVNAFTGKYVLRHRKLSYPELEHNYLVLHMEVILLRHYISKKEQLELTAKQDGIVVPMTPKVQISNRVAVN